MNLAKELKNVSKDLNLLYVEDDIQLQAKTALLLNNFFSNCVVANDGEEALKYYKEHEQIHKKYFDIVISDIQMPNKDGIELTKDILQLNDQQIIIIVSAYDDSHYLIDLINLGIHNFISKPFLSNKFLNIIYKCCQKIKKNSIKNLIKFNNDYIWNRDSLVLTFLNEQIKLSKNEISILNLMLLNPNQVFSVDMLFNTIYYDNIDKDFSIDSIKSIIKRLRKKLPSNMIESIYSQGYKINSDIDLVLV